MNRGQDWMRQAQRDLAAAEWAMQGEFCEQACFHAQQAAEKALKGLCQALRAEARGHALISLLGELGTIVRVPESVRRAARALDRHYIQTRYPNGFHWGAPLDYYDLQDAEQAIRHAKAIIAFCNKHISR